MVVKEGNCLLELERLGEFCALLLGTSPCSGAHFCLGKSVSTPEIPLYRRCSILGFARTPKTFLFVGKGINLSGFYLILNTPEPSIQGKALG